MLWDDIPPIEQPKSLLPRGKSLLNLGNMKGPTSIMKTSSEPKIDNNFDLPPIFSNEIPTKKASFDKDELPKPFLSNNNEPLFDNPIPSPRPSRLLLSGSLTSKAQPQSQPIPRPDITHPIIQTSANPTGSLHENDVLQFNDLQTKVNTETNQRDNGNLKEQSVFSSQVNDTCNIPSRLLNQQVLAPKNEFTNTANQCQETIANNSVQLQISPIPLMNHEMAFQRDNDVKIQKEGNADKIVCSQISSFNDNSHSCLCISNESSLMKIPLSPTSSFEGSFSTSMDRTFSSFKRSISRGIFSSIRQTDNTDSSIFDNFIDGLVNNIKEIVDSNEKAPEINSETICNLFNKCFDDGVKPIRRSFSNIEQERQRIRDQKKEELDQVNQSLTSLKSYFQDVGSSFLKEIDTIKKQTFAQKDELLTAQNELERKKRTLSLLYSDYQGRAQHQSLEYESLDRITKQTENAIAELEVSSKTKTSIVSEKISKEASQILDILEKRNDISNNDSCSQLAFRISEITDSINEDVSETESLILKLENSKKTVYHPREISRSQQQWGCVSAAERIQENRRIREISKRDIANHIRTLEENELFENSFN